MGTQIMETFFSGLFPALPKFSISMRIITVILNMRQLNSNRLSPHIQTLSMAVPPGMGTLSNSSFSLIRARVTTALLRGMGVTGKLI